MDAQITTAALRAIRRILRATEQGGRRLAAATGLTPSQLLVLQEIARHTEVTPGEVAATLHFGQATVTNIVDRLVASGFATRRRSDRDKRQIILEATTDGRVIVEAAPDLLQVQFRERFEALAPWEQAMILAALERLGGILDATDIDAAPLIDTGQIDRTAGA